MSRQLFSLALVACMLAPCGFANAGEADTTVKKFKEKLIVGGVASKADLESKMNGVAKHEYIHEALLKYNSAYKQAFQLSKSDPLGVVAWSKVIEAKPDKFQVAEAHYRLGRSFLLLEEFEKAAKEFEFVNSKLGEFTTRSAESHLFLAYAYGKIDMLREDNTAMKTKRAKHVLGQMLKNYPTAPERYLETARWFLRELKGQGSGPLLELSKRMDTIRRLLKKGETGKNPTQDRQKKVVQELERLIKMLEEQQKNKGKGQGKCKKCKGKGCKSCSKPGQKPGSKPGNKPLEDSKLPGGSSKVGKLRRDAKRGTKEAWGNARDKERAKVLDVLKERYPEQYKEIIEQYYRRINKGKRN